LGIPPRPLSSVKTGRTSKTRTDCGLVIVPVLGVSGVPPCVTNVKRDAVSRVSLDSTSVVRSRLHTPPARPSAAACQAGDDDVEEGDNGVDNGSAGSADGVDDGHEAVAYGAEDGLNLSAALACCCWKGGVEVTTYARNDGTHDDGFMSG
jgi:hypothetical protein